jgi:hypothetical protein
VVTLRTAHPPTPPEETPIGGKRLKVRPPNVPAARARQVATLHEGCSGLRAGRVRERGYSHGLTEPAAPRGRTALLDATGKFITDIDEQL